MIGLKRFRQIGILVLLATIGLGSAELSFAAAAKGRVSPSPWPSLLQLLNREPELAMPWFKGDIDVDLLALYRSELGVIADEWKARPESRASPKSAETKRLTNEFFHQRIQAHNAQTFAVIEKIAPSSAVPPQDFYSLAQKILVDLRRNPVANLEATQSYDPSGQLGFCFGRALLVHHFLLKAGVKQEDIAKIFSAGELRVGHKIWSFHVAVMVRDAKHGFLVIDPIYETPMALETWKAKTAAFDMKGKLSRARFYLTDPRKFLPSYGAYNVRELENEHLKNYFTDLALSLAR